MSSDASDDVGDYNDVDQLTAGHKERLKATGPNGHRPIDHRPPEKLLKRAEKKVARYIDRKKVNYYGFGCVIYSFESTCKHWL